MVTSSPAAFEVLARAQELLADLRDDELEVELSTYRLSLWHLNGRHEEVLADWRRVVTLAEQLGRRDLRCYAQVYGSGSMIVGDDAGGALITEAIEQGLEDGQLEPVARGYTNVVEFLMPRRHWVEAVPTMDRALAFYDDHDFRAHRFNTVAQRARLHVLHGEWSQAAEELQRLRASYAEPIGVLESIPLEAEALLATRSGVPEAEALLERAWDVASCSGSAQYLIPVACAGIEWAWLCGCSSGSARRQPGSRGSSCAPSACAPSHAGRRA
jgi:hypothetical protein